MILCNKLEIMFDRKNINRDFEIFMISKEKGNYFSTNILDRASQEFRAKSVVYNFGNKWFVMFDKNDVDYEKFKSIIAEEDAESIINKIDVLDENSIYTDVLAQLLFNLLGAPSRKDMAFNNISGKLYYFRNEYMKKMPKSFYVIQLRVTKASYLSLSVKTFSCINNVCAKPKQAKYLFDQNSGRFRKKLKDDIVDDSKVYIEKALTPKKKNKVDFLNFASYEQFCNSKIGIYAEFMQDVKELLSDYVTIDFGGYSEYKSFTIEDDEFEIQEYARLLKTKGVCIIDDVQNEHSIELLNNIKYELLTFYGVNCYCNKCLEGAYTIRIIHNREYYEKNEINDIYQECSKYDIIQHVTVEDFKMTKEIKNHPALKKIIQELIIKGDIIDKKFSIVNWKSEDHIIKFVNARHYWYEDGKKKKKSFIFYRMTIYSNGKFEVDTHDSNEYTDDEEWNVIVEAYSDYDGEWKDREIEGIVYYDYLNLNIIMKTEQHTLPNVFKLENALKLSNKENYINVSILLETLEEFKAIYIKYGDTEEIKLLKSTLESYYREDIQISEILKIISIKKKCIKEFNKYIFQTRGLLLHPTPKEKEIKEYYFGSVLDIKYFYNDNKLYYFVGTKNKDLQLSLHNACLLREVVSTGDNIFFEKLLRLLAVEFVRNGQYTVVPFPFKYLNEIILMDN